MTALYAVAETNSDENEPVVWPFLYTTLKEVVNIKLAEIKESFEGDEELIKRASEPFLEFQNTEHLNESDYLEIWYLDVVTVIRRVTIAS